MRHLHSLLGTQEDSFRRPQAQGWEPGYHPGPGASSGGSRYLEGRVTKLALSPHIDKRAGEGTVLRSWGRGPGYPNFLLYALTLEVACLPDTPLPYPQPTITLKHPIRLQIFFFSWLPSTLAPASLSPLKPRPPAQ